MKLKCDEPLANFAFNCNLRRYNEAREAWMRRARDDVTVSGGHKEVASIIGELGVHHVVERLTDDGYFSVRRCRLTPVFASPE